ncbi:16026_t:CDS:2, partial [Racocetra persica]
DLIEFKIIEKENVADLNAFSGLVENISYKLRDFSSSIKVISLIKESENKSNSFKEILLSDIFEIKEGLTKYTKKFIDENPGEYPVYSSQTTNQGIIVFLRKGKFSITNNCGALMPKKEAKNLLLDYLYCLLSESLKNNAVGSGNKRITVETIKSVKIK